MITLLLYILSFNTSTFSDEAKLRWVTPTSIRSIQSISYDGKYAVNRGFGSFNVIDIDSNKIVWSEFFEINRYMFTNPIFSNINYNFHFSNDSISFVFDAESKKLIKSFNPNDIILNKTKLEFFKWEANNNSLIYKESGTENFYGISLDGTYKVLENQNKDIKTTNSINDSLYYFHKKDFDTKPIVYIALKNNEQLIDSIKFGAESSASNNEMIYRIFVLDSNNLAIYLYINLRKSHTPSFNIYSLNNKKLILSDTSSSYYDLRFDDDLLFVKENGEVMIWEDEKFQLLKQLKNNELIKLFNYTNRFVTSFETLTLLDYKNQKLIFDRHDGILTIADFETEEINESIVFFNRYTLSSVWSENNSIIVRAGDTLARFDVNGKIKFNFELDYNEKILQSDNDNNFYITNMLEIFKLNSNLEYLDTFNFSLSEAVIFFKLSSDKKKLLVKTFNDKILIIDLLSRERIEIDKMGFIEFESSSSFDFNSQYNKLIIYSSDYFYLYDVETNKSEFDIYFKNTTYNWEYAKFKWIDDKNIIVENPSNLIGRIDVENRKFKSLIPDSSFFESKDVQFYYFKYLDDGKSYLTLTNEGLYRIDIENLEIIDKINTPSFLKDNQFIHYNLSPDMTKLFFAMRNGVGMFDVDFQFTSVEKYEKLEIEVFPNPTNDILNINNTQSIEMDLILVNSLGLTLQDFTLSPNSSITLNLESYRNGMYILKDQNSGATYKFIIYK